MRVSDITYTGLSGAGRFSATLPPMTGGWGILFPRSAQAPTQAARLTESYRSTRGH